MIGYVFMHAIPVTQTTERAPNVVFEVTNHVAYARVSDVFDRPFCEVPYEKLPADINELGAVGTLARQFMKQTSSLYPQLNVPSLVFAPPPCYTVDQDRIYPKHAYFMREDGNIGSHLDPKEIRHFHYHLMQKFHEIKDRLKKS